MFEDLEAEISELSVRWSKSITNRHSDSVRVKQRVPAFLSTPPSTAKEMIISYPFHTVVESTAMSVVM